MRKYFLVFNLILAGSFIATAVYALPAPSTLNEREKRALASTPTPTPRPQPQIQTQTQTQVQARPQTQRPPQSQTQTQTRTTKSTTTAVAREGPRSSTTVVIDAGHGGFDRGGIAGQRVSEKDMTLDVALRLRAVLQSYGYRTVMTRDRDVFIPLGTRVAIANSYRDAIFVCIHFNATPRRAASGIETYFYSSQSLGLASAIHYYVAGGAPSANRGVRRRGFYVLRNTRIPSVLVECGFLTNPTEASYAQNASYRQKLALEIAHGVQNRTSVGRIASARVVSSSSSTALEPETVPLQPFLDQTHYRDPDLSRSKHKRSSKSSKSTSSKRKKLADSDSASDTPKKKSTKKKKSASAQTED
jgi:N-acetylmuramoyl-L-alanine amidase